MACENGALETERPQGRGAFFGRRKGKKLRSRQAGLLDASLPALTIDLERAAQGLDALFDARFERAELEIGFGGGERLAAAADRERSTAFIGCEPFVNGVAKMLVEIERLGLANVRLHPGDAADLLAALPSACLDRVHLLYPDPWPKRRQRKRRFVNATTLKAIARVLRPGGEFRFATDIDDYAAWTLARLAQEPAFAWRPTSAKDWTQPWQDWVQTRYESKALAEGRPPVYLTFVRSIGPP